jgi:hypothetical protein
MSPCSGLVQNGQCKCTFVVTHFSTFAVGDAVGDAVPLDPTNQPQPQSPPSSAPSAPNIAAIAGGIAGGLVLIAIIAFLVMKARKPTVPASSPSDLQKPAGTEMQQVAIDHNHAQPVTMPQYSTSVSPLGNVQQ